jgi:hypothetical protein
MFILHDLVFLIVTGADVLGRLAEDHSAAELLRADERTAKTYRMLPVCRRLASRARE